MSAIDVESVAEAASRAESLEELDGLAEEVFCDAGPAAIFLAARGLATRDDMGARALAANLFARSVDGDRERALRAADALLDLLRIEDEPWVVGAALFALDLVDVPAPQALDVLLPFVADEDATVRWYVCRALRSALRDETLDTPVDDALAALINDASDGVAMNAVEAVCIPHTRRGPMVVEALRSRLPALSPDALAEAALALAESGDESAVDLLGSLLADADQRGVDAEVLRAILQAAAVAADPALYEPLLAIRGRVPEAVARTHVAALAWCAPPEPGPHEGYDPRRARWLSGKTIIVGYTHVTPDGNPVRQSQAYGVVVSADATTLTVEKPDGSRFTLPPATDVFRYATLGEYRLRATGEVVVDPDALASWVIEAPSEGE
jgi:hypothetical protein